MHAGPVRVLDFNPNPAYLLASGGVSGGVRSFELYLFICRLTLPRVYIWDLKEPRKLYTPTPGSRSTKLDEITSAACNHQVQCVLAGSRKTGHSVVSDLRGKRAAVALTYGGGAGNWQGMPQVVGRLLVGDEG
jgi:protein transport protein SEC31